MTPAERRRLILGDKVIGEIHERVARAPEAPEHVIEELRRIFASVANNKPQPAITVCCDQPQPEPAA